MSVNVYEGMFILDPNKYSRDPGGVSEQLAEMIRKHNGEILASRLWEERRLAYPIAGQRRGAYWLMYFKLDGRELRAISRECEISDNILRHLFLKVDPRIADTLVEHALSGRVGQSRVVEAEEQAEGEAVGAAAGGGEEEGESEG